MGNNEVAITPIPDFPEQLQLAIDKMAGGKGHHGVGAVAEVNAHRFLYVATKRDMSPLFFHDANEQFSSLIQKYFEVANHYLSYENNLQEETTRPYFDRTARELRTLVKNIDIERPEKFVAFSEILDDVRSSYLEVDPGKPEQVEAAFYEFPHYLEQLLITNNFVPRFGLTLRSHEDQENVVFKTDAFITGGAGGRSWVYTLPSHEAGEWKSIIDQRV